MKEIIEDTITRNREFQEKRREIVKRLKELDAPDSVIEFEEMVSKMTLTEYQLYRKKCEEEDKKAKSEYARNNAIQKSIVDEIYLRESKLEYDYFRYVSGVHLMMAIDPLDFMSKDDFDNDLYTPFLEHSRDIYRNRFKERFGIENEQQD